VRGTQLGEGRRVRTVKAAANEQSLAAQKSEDPGRAFGIEQASRQRIAIAGSDDEVDARPVSEDREALPGAAR